MNLILHNAVSVTKSLIWDTLILAQTELPYEIYDFDDDVDDLSHVPFKNKEANTTCYFLAFQFLCATT